MNPSRAKLVAFAVIVASCAIWETPDRIIWRSEWNQSVAAAKSDWENPCGTRAFIAWADGFLVGCEPAAATGPSDCDARRDWVRERVKQCRTWTAWQMRNFNKHERTDGEAPSMRIE